MLRRIVFICMLDLLGYLHAARVAHAQSLSDNIKRMIGMHEGTVAVAVRHLSTGESFEHRASDPQATASLIKFPVMIAAYRRHEQGKLSIEKKITLRNDDKVQGSGILTTHFSAGTSLSLRDAIRLMMAYSDNTATNLVLEEIGLSTTNDVMIELGLVNTRIHSKVFRRDTSIDPDRSERYGLGSTTAGEMVQLCSLLEDGKLANPANTKEMIAHMQACDDKLKVRRYLPPGTKLAHKTGSVNKVRCDSGILECDQGSVAYCILTEDNVDQSWGENNKGDLLCSEIGKAIFQRYRSSETKSNRTTIQEFGIGASGPLVSHLQRTLNARLVPTPKLTVDGEFGPSTQTAVIELQKQSGLEPTGKLTTQTWKKLGPLLPEVASTSVENPGNLPQKMEPDPTDGPPLVTASAWIVTDAESGQVLFEKDGEALRDPASTTKIMTALLVVEQAAKHPEVLDEVITFSKRADSTVGSTSDLFAGEKIAVRELLFGLMLPSGNDASVAFAEHFGDRFKTSELESGGYPSFIAAMNRKAAELNLRQTHFENSHGLTHVKHKSTAHDLAALARYAWTQPLFRELVSCRIHNTVVESELGYSRMLQWRNTNKLLDIEGYDGIKTGTTDAAGACLVSSCRRGGRHLIVVVLGAKSSEARYTETRNLFRWAWSQTGVK
jgi:serine-type D-Ala-D-Ala carboxypeptidase (penicillin-binding protein 5/6)